MNLQNSTVPVGQCLISLQEVRGWGAVDQYCDILYYHEAKYTEWDVVDIDPDYLAQQKIQFKANCC